MMGDEPAWADLLRPPRHYNHVLARVLWFYTQARRRGNREAPVAVDHHGLIGSRLRPCVLPRPVSSERSRATRLC